MAQVTLPRSNENNTYILYIQKPRIAINLGTAQNVQKRVQYANEKKKELYTNPPVT